MDSRESQETKERNSKRNRNIACIAGVLIGAIMLLCGLFSVTGNSSMDNALISGGTTQTCDSLIDTYPDAASVLDKIADVMEASMDLRENSSPVRMNAFLESCFSEEELRQCSARTIIQAIMVYVNSAYEKSATEEEYWEKIRSIVSGIRSSVSSYSQKAS